MAFSYEVPWLHKDYGTRYRADCLLEAFKNALYSDGPPEARWSQASGRILRSDGAYTVLSRVLWSASRMVPLFWELPDGEREEATHAENAAFLAAVWCGSSPDCALQMLLEYPDYAKYDPANLRRALAEIGVGEAFGNDTTPPEMVERGIAFLSAKWREHDRNMAEEEEKSPETSAGAYQATCDGIAEDLRVGPMWDAAETIRLIVQVEWKTPPQSRPLETPQQA